MLRSAYRKRYPTTGHHNGVDMKTAEQRNETIECYQDADFKDEKFVETCQQARQLWDRRADE